MLRLSGFHRVGKWKQSPAARRSYWTGMLGEDGRKLPVMNCLNLMRIRKTVLLLLCISVSTSAWSRVFLRWTFADVPPPKTLGINDLVVSWNDDAPSLLESARKQGYQVYLEATPQQASAAAAGV